MKQLVAEEILRKYARLAVCSGANVQQGQPLLIRSTVDAAYFVELCVEEGYKAGASLVIVDWSDERVSRTSYQYAETEVLAEVPQYAVEKMQYYIDHNFALLSVSANTPGMLAGIDGEKIQAVQMASSKALGKFREHTMGNHTQWSIVAIPTVGWAKKVFPADDEETAMKKLWDAILLSVRVNADNDPVEEWKKHNETIHHHSELLNGYNFKELHFKNNIGTDLTVGLVKNHIWSGGSEVSTKDVVFNPNMPTEECFCMPDKYHVNGTVHATKPLNRNGKLIEDFKITFRDGKAVSWSAEKEEEALKGIITFDEGSCYLGEVALISYDSPISNSGILFYNTLFDENASCHLALGAAYPMNLQGGTKMSREELNAAGANDSMEHCDFMFGSADMAITGVTYDGKEVAIFKDGNFII